jgi:hypothetical protein
LLATLICPANLEAVRASNDWTVRLLGSIVFEASTATAAALSQTRTAQPIRAVASTVI